MQRTQHTLRALPGGLADKSDELEYVTLQDSQNSIVGLDAGNKLAMQSSTNNVLVGTRTGKDMERGSTSVFVGALAAEQSNRVGDCVGIGYAAMRHVQDVYSSVSVGTQAGERLRRVEFATSLGYRAMASSVAGSRNVAVGALAGLASRGADNVLVGALAGTSLNSFQSTVVGTNAGRVIHGDLNTVVGAYATANCSDASNIVVIGAKAGSDANNIHSSVLVGSAAGQGLTQSSALVAIGADTLLSGEAVSNSVFVGAGAGSSIMDVDKTVVIGCCAGEMLENASGVTAVGADALMQTRSASNTVVVGSMAGMEATDLSDSVFVGHAAARYAQNVQTSTVVGAEAGEYMNQGDYNVLAGYRTGRGLVDSFFNTIVGANSAANTVSNFSTVVGSNSLNRRNGEQVAFSNVVVIGENVRFDLPLKSVTLQPSDAAFIDPQEGTPYDDPNHAFAEKHRLLNRVSWLLEEAQVGDDLQPEERAITIFASLEMGRDAVYTIKWGTDTIDPSLPAPYTVIVRFPQSAISPIQVELYIDSNNDPVVVESIVYDGSYQWMDLTVSYLPGTESIDITHAFFLGGIVMEYTSRSFVVEPETLIPFVNGFQLQQATTTQPIGSRSYVHLLASNSTYGPVMSAYASVTYNARVDAVFQTTAVALQSTLGNGTTEDITQGQPVSNALTASLLLVDSEAWPGLTGAEYIFTTYQINGTASFLVQPDKDSVVGLEWFGEEGELNTGIKAQLLINGEGDGSLTLQVSDDTHTFLYIDKQRMLTETEVTLIGGTQLPFSTIDDLLVGNASDLWITMAVLAVEPDQPALTLTLAGYSSGAYEQGIAPERTVTYSFRIPGAGPLSYDFINTGRMVIFADSMTSNVIASGIQVLAVTRRNVPVFDRCVFLGSNFVVTESESNVFLVNLGPEFQLMRGTPNKFDIHSASTAMDGSATVGANVSNLQHISFGSAFGSYVGRSVYISAETSAETPELFLCSTQNPPNATGLDRVRVLSGSLQVDILPLSLGSGEPEDVAPSLATVVASEEAQTMLTVDETGLHLSPQGNAYLPSLASSTFISVNASGQLLKSNALDASYISNLASERLVVTNSANALVTSSIAIDASNNLVTAADITAKNIYGNIQTANIVSGYLNLTNLKLSSFTNNKLLKSDGTANVTECTNISMDAANNIVSTANITASGFFGNGSGLTSILASTVLGNFTGVEVTGTVSSGIVTVPYRSLFGGFSTRNALLRADASGAGNIEMSSLYGSGGILYGNGAVANASAGFSASISAAQYCRMHGNGTAFVSNSLTIGANVTIDNLDNGRIKSYDFIFQDLGTFTGGAGQGVCTFSATGKILKSNTIDVVKITTASITTPSITTSGTLTIASFNTPRIDSADYYFNDSVATNLFTAGGAGDGVVTFQSPSGRILRSNIINVAKIVNTNAPYSVNCPNIEASSNLVCDQFWGNTAGGMYLNGLSTNSSAYVCVMTANGRMAKSSVKTFDIPHPVTPTTHRLLHSCIEGPRIDLMYRGTAYMICGKATVDLNAQCTESTRGGMMPGTFQALCRNPAVFLQNVSDFDKVKGHVNINTAQLHIVCENAQSNAGIDWMVVAERKDPYIMQCSKTDAHGYLILEPPNMLEDPHTVILT